MRTTNISIHGMHCAGCAAKVERALKALPGIEGVNVMLTLSRAQIIYDETKLEDGAILAAVRTFGYTSEVIRANQSLYLQAESMRIAAAREKMHYKISFQLSALLTLPLLGYMVYMAAGMTGGHNALSSIVQACLSGLVLVVGGRIFFVGAWHDAKKFTIGMDGLVALGALIVYGFSLYNAFLMRHPAHAYFETPALLLAFVLFGKWLEVRARSDASESLRQLMSSAAREAVVEIGGENKIIAAEAILPQDVYVLRAGDVVPADGEVVSGEALVDEALLTGEAVPVMKTAGSRVSAGTVNTNGLLKVRATAAVADSILAKIVDALINAQAKRPRLQRIADIVASRFSLAVMLCAVLTFVLWALFIQPDDWGTAIWRAAAVMVVACPCAIGLATPLAIMAATGRMLKAGVVFRDGEALERAAKTQVLIFDKTGTLTTGELIVQQVHVTNQEDATYIQTLAASMAAMSGHPLSKALAAHTSRRVDIGSIHEIAGAGVTAIANGRRVALGSREFIGEAKISNCSQAMLNSTVFLAIEGEVAGGFELSDYLRDDAVATVERLRACGIEPVIASGDIQDKVASIASAVGITEYYYRQSPFDKRELVDKYQADGCVVAMCGDGINDAVALAQADVGIAVAASADVAQLTAAVNVLRNDLGAIADVFVMSKATIRNIKQNFVWAAVYNIVMIPVAMFSGISPALCGLMMALSSVSVALNALRLRWRKI